MKKTQKPYSQRIHVWGRISSLTAILVLFSVPLLISVHYDAFPEFTSVAKALLTIIPLYWTSGIIEVLTYAPMLGAGGTYLSFVTGNITNLKMPCGINAMNNANVSANSPEGEVISTIAIASSSITTTVILAVGVLAFGPILPLIKENPVIAPAFSQILPAIFGALLASYFAKHWRISIFPILIGIVTLFFAPQMGVGVLIFVTIVASVLGAFAMYKLKLV